MVEKYEKEVKNDHWVRLSQRKLQVILSKKSNTTKKYTSI